MRIRRVVDAVADAEQFTLDSLVTPGGIVVGRLGLPGRRDRGNRYGSRWRESGRVKAGADKKFCAQ
jgi:hypothetical protein